MRRGAPRCHGRIASHPRALALVYACGRVSVLLVRACASMCSYISFSFSSRLCRSRVVMAEPAAAGLSGAPGAGFAGGESGGRARPGGLDVGGVAGAPDAPRVAADPEVPRALLRRLVRAQLSAAGPPGGASSALVSRDVLLALGEALKIFVHYLSAAASDACREGGRQTVGDRDVLRALEDLELEELLPSVQEALDEKKTTRAAKKKRIEKATAPEEGREGGGEGEAGAGVGADEGRERVEA